MLRNNDNIQIVDLLNSRSKNYLKKGKKKDKNTSIRKGNNNIPNLNFFFMNGRPHIGDNSHLNIPTLNEIQIVGRNLQNSINDRLNQILQNPVRNNDQVLNELRNIRSVQIDINDRILPNIGQAIERGNALNEAGLVINSSNPVGRNPDGGPDLRRSQQSQVVPVIENLQQYGPLNPYLEQLVERARQLPKQYGSLEPENRTPSQPPPPSESERNMNVSNESMGMINRSAQSTRVENDDDDSDEESFQDVNFSTRTPQSAGTNNLSSFATPPNNRRLFSPNPVVVSSQPAQHIVSMPSGGGFGGVASRNSLNAIIEDSEGRVLSPRGIFEDRD